MIVALDALPEKRLTESALEKDGEVCAMGAVGLKRGINMKEIDSADRYEVAAAFGISPALAAEISYENDEYWRDTPENRWQRMRKWAESKTQNRSKP